MKRILVVIATLLVGSVMASAKGGFGVTAGLDFNSIRVQDVKMDAKAGWNAGVVYSFDFPAGFSVQPSVLYSQKSAELGISGMTHTLGSVDIPVSVQWGPNLIVARPFLDVTPYVGYSLVNNIKGSLADFKAVLKGKKSLDYGVGVGAGLSVWKLQAVVRYNWSFGAMDSLDGFSGKQVENLKSDGVYGGVSVNVAYFF